MGGLGRFWAPKTALERIKKEDRFSDRKRGQPPKVLGSFLEGQNGTKIDPKMRSKTECEKMASWSRLWAILGRFRRKKHSRKQSVPPGNGKSTFLNERGVQERSGSEKERKRVPKGRQNGSQNGTKTRSKFDPKNRAKKTSKKNPPA